MDKVTPVLNSSMPLITPGYPLVKVPMSHPVAQVAVTATANPAKTQDVIEATTHDTVLKNSGHIGDGV